MLGFGHPTSKPKVKSDSSSINTGTVGVFYPQIPTKSLKNLNKTNRKIKSAKKKFKISYIILPIGIITYFSIVPEILNNVFSDSWSSNTIHRTLLVSFITVLFFIGYFLNKKPKPLENVILKNKEPYLMIRSIREQLNEIKPQVSHKELNSLIYAIKCLEEKLSIESDFGCGNPEIINCENQIAKEIQILNKIMSEIKMKKIDTNIKTFNAIIKNIESLLYRRMELKRK